MLKIKNKFTKRILALALSGAMIVSSLTTSGLTADAAETPRNTRGGYYEESSAPDTDSGNAQVETAEEDEGNKDAEKATEAENNADSEETAKTEIIEAEPTKAEPEKTEPAKETIDASADKDANWNSEGVEASSTEARDEEKDEKAEDVKAYTYSAPSASAKSSVWSNYEVFRGSVFGVSSADATDKTHYELGTDTGNMRIQVKNNGNKIASTDDGRAMYFYQVPIDSTFELKAKAKINSIGNIGDDKQEKNDGQVGFGLMARDDMLIDVKYDSTEGPKTYLKGEGYSSNYVVAGTLMGSAKATVEALKTSINCFSREGGTLNRGVSLGKIITTGEYDLSLKFDGTKYTCQINDYAPVEYTVSLNNIDSAYQYIGMFAVRKADITFSDIYLKVDDERILDQVSPRYNVTVSKEGNGTATADGDVVIVGDTVTLTAKPEKGYYLDDWQILTGENLVTNFEIGDDNKFTMPGGNVSVKAIFKELPTEWDFEHDTKLQGKSIEQTTGKLAGLKIDATNGKFDSTDLMAGGAQISQGTTITVPLAGACTLTVVGEDANYKVDGTTAETAEDSFQCGGIFLKTAVITATEDTVIKCISVGDVTEEVVIPETPRKIDVWDFGAKQESNSNYVNHIKASDWNNYAGLGSDGKFVVSNTTGIDTVCFGDLTLSYGNNDRLYSETSSKAYNKQGNNTMSATGAYAYGDYTAAGEWYCNGVGGDEKRYITIENVVAGDIIYAYVGTSDTVKTNFHFDYLGTDGEQAETGSVDKNKKLEFIAKYSGTYKIWADAVQPDSDTAAGKPTWNRIVRYPGAVVQGSVDWAGISTEGVSIQFVNNTTNEATEAVFDSAGYAVMLAPGYTYTAKLFGKEGYGFAESCRKVTVSANDGINGKTHNLVVQDLETLPKQAVSGKFIGSGEVPLTGVEVEKLEFRNLDDDYTYEAAVANDAYSVNLRKGTYIAEITAEGYSTRTHVIVNNASVERDIFLASTDTSQLPLVKDLYVGYSDKEENNFPTINAALRAAKRMNPQSEAERITIHIHPGTYREQVYVDTNYITFVNDTPDKDVVITWYYGIGYAYYSVDAKGYYDEECAFDKYEKHNATRWGCAVRVKATDFKAKYIIFENSFNRYMTEEEIADGVTLSTAGTDSKATFKRTASVTPTQAASKDATERAAAIALDTGSDRSEFYKCKILGSQDTLYTGDGSSRAYYKECFISGNTDYIFGDGNQVFENCELNWQGYTSGANGGYITAAKDASSLGYLFYNCTVTKNKTSGYTVATGFWGRPWGAKAKVIFANTVLEASNLIHDKGWDQMSGKDPSDANFGEYNTTLKDGTKVTPGTSPRKEICEKTTENNPIDTKEKLKAYFGDWKPAFYSDGSGGEGGENPGSTEEGGDNPSSTGGEGSSTEESSGDEGSSTGGDNTTKEDSRIEIKLLKTTYDYTGDKIIPEFEVYDGKKLLSEGVDYTVTYKDNKEPGPAKIIVKGKGNYVADTKNEVTAIFTIEAVTKVTENLIDLKGAKIKITNRDSSNDNYTGDAQYPDFILTRKENNTSITETYVYNATDKVYKTEETPISANVAVSNNVNKGNATILITGANNTKAKAKFKITAVNLSKATNTDLVITPTETDYAVKGAECEVTVTYKGKSLTKGKDYTVKYAKNKAASENTATVTITGMGNYAKKCKEPTLYKINKLNMQNLEIKAVTAYNGIKVNKLNSKVKATIVDGKGDALKPSQYTLEVKAFRGTTQLGATDELASNDVVKVTATAKDTTNLVENSETIETEFTVGTDISKAKVVSAKGGKNITKEYTGAPIILKDTDLTVTLKVGKETKTLTKDDYEIVAHSNNINKGTATVVIKGKGTTYSGTKTFKFKITQKKMVQK